LMASCPLNLTPLRELGEDSVGKCLSTRCVSTDGALRLLAHGAYQAWRFARNPNTGLYVRALSLLNVKGAVWETGDTEMTGLGMAFECAAHAMNFISLAQAQDHVLLTLRSLTNATRHVRVGRSIQGCFTSTINTVNGHSRERDACDTGNTAVLLSGAMVARTYFRNIAPASPATREISDRAMKLFNAIRWEQIALCEFANNSTTGMLWKATVEKAKGGDLDRPATALKVPKSIDQRGVCQAAAESSKVNTQALFLQMAHYSCVQNRSKAYCDLVEQQWETWRTANLTVGKEFWHSYFINHLTEGSRLEELGRIAKEQVQAATQEGLLTPTSAVNYLQAAKDDALPFVLKALADAKVDTIVSSSGEPSFMLLSKTNVSDQRGINRAWEASDLSAALFGLTAPLGVDWWHAQTAHFV